MMDLLKIALLLISPASAFRLHRRSVDIASETAVTRSPSFPMDVPVLIRSHRHQNLQDEGGQVKVTFNSDAWEQWVISDAGNGTVIIKSHRNQHLQDKSGKIKLSGNTQEWEQWTIASVGNGKVTIKSHRNQYLQDNNGRVMVSPNSDEWEHWSIVTPNAGGKAWGCPDTGAEVKILTYNLFWWNLFDRRKGNGGSAGRLIATHSSPPNGPEFDIMGFQECGDVNWVLSDAGLSDSYGTLSHGHGLCIAFRTSSWSLLADGIREVGRDKPGLYGARAVQWGRFKHREHGITLFFMNFHGPLPVGTGGAYGGTATANNILSLAHENAHSTDSIVFTGDFNQPPWASMIKALDGSLERLFTGKSFGGVDHIYSSCDESRIVDKWNMGNGGSDHDALKLTIRM